MNLYHDNLEDRKELWKMLSHYKMTDDMRIRFVSSCCRNSANSRLRFEVQKGNYGEYTPYQAQMDILALVFQCGLDLGVVLGKLTSLVRKL